MSYNTNGDSFQHGLAILSMPTTSVDRIANEAILETALRQGANKLSIMLRSDDYSSSTHSIASLRKYVGEVYSNLWDCEMGSDHPERVLDAIVYVQNLPNAAPEQWIHHVPDLDYIVSHDSICGWTSEEASGRGSQYQNVNGDGAGGLGAYVEAINADRAARKLSLVTAIPADPWPNAASPTFLRNNNVQFLDDDAVGKEKSVEDDEDSAALLGGAVIPTKSLFSSVCVGGTFDGMHYGHRKLLTLAVSSVQPQTGKLLVGVTVDEMLKHKEYAELIPPLKERMADVKDFLHRLAPGMKNRIRIVPISDTFGPPGSDPDFDALVLSHETLDNGHCLNEHRVKQGFEPLHLLCTRRTEPHGMSSTALRRLRQQAKERENIRI
jgi:pantetheine-phosphate adenylyltransferase/syntaxin 1B/2/3